MSSQIYKFGRAEEATHPDSTTVALAEFVSILIFVFASEGSALALGIFHFISFILFVWLFCL
ncbi:hypothetical protein MANES_18G092750v8 [Manihot esculenta]|uniref:Uncharacterized protein n=1 Tax=Manihot esculenta TaxID=3983 RepID=A0ACB7FZD7_MANES|nr:hypothetical protein MANES_18G092750v8 [Manihot esculenta]